MKTVKDTKPNLINIIPFTEKFIRFQSASFFDISTNFIIHIKRFIAVNRILKKSYIKTIFKMKSNRVLYSVVTS